jgi:hypothetical protein
MNDPDVFVACNLNWYPVKGNNKKVTAPDVMAAFGRQKGDRSSYMQWKEANVPPTVVFEILSPSNSEKEMEEKFVFYEQFGVGEYYVYDPDWITLKGFLRDGDSLVPIPEMHNWVSPRLRIRFDLSGDELVVWRPDNVRFQTFSELVQSKQEQYLRAEAQHKRADDALQIVEKERQRADEEHQRAELLLAKLKAHGIDPNAP